MTTAVQPIRRALARVPFAPTLVTLFMLSVALFPTWTVDDAYITLRYARNLVEHGALTWNISDPPVEGYTGILWPLLAAGAMWAHLDPLLVLKGVSWASAGAMLYLADDILTTLHADQGQRRIALLLLVVSPWAIHTGSGLETMLFTALILASVLAWLRRSPHLHVILLLTALTRPEGVAVAAVLLGVGLWSRRQDGADLVDFAGRSALFFMLPSAAYFAWRWTYYGMPLPNTFYAKSGSGVSSWPHVSVFLSSGVLLSAMAWWQSSPDGRLLRPVRVLALSLAVLIGLLLLFYGRSELLMDYGMRFFMPLLPLFIIALAASWGKMGLTLLLAAHLSICASTYVGNAIWASNYNQMNASEHIPAAAWLADHAQPHDTLMVIVDAGIIPYTTDLRTIDVGALNDPYLARERDPVARLNYLFNQKPEWVLLANGNLGIVAAEATRTALLVDPRWRSGYELAAEFHGPQSFEYHQQVWRRK